MGKIVSIKNCDTQNGKGIRVSIFFSGCQFYCKDCFNNEIWDFNLGEEFNEKYYKTKIKPLITEHIDGISILGGEPMHPNNVNEVYQLCWLFKKDFPDKNVWLWTGYTYEEIVNMEMQHDEYGRKWIPAQQQMLINGMIDILVDGRFEIDKKDLRLKWRGSTNQRVIDVKESNKTTDIILYSN